MDTRVADRTAVCRHLRSKGAGVVYGEPIQWDNGYFPNAVFWCLATSESVGPDDQFVHPHVCGANRPCFCGTPQPSAWHPP
jgi:hypothetical protein